MARLLLPQSNQTRYRRFGDYPKSNSTQLDGNSVHERPDNRLLFQNVSNAQSVVVFSRLGLQTFFRKFDTRTLDTANVVLDWELNRM